MRGVLVLHIDQLAGHLRAKLLTDMRAGDVRGVILIETCRQVACVRNSSLTDELGRVVLVDLQAGRLHAEIFAEHRRLVWCRARSPPG